MVVGVLHRITGVAIFFPRSRHILDTSLVRLSPQAYNAVIDQYKTPIMERKRVVAAIGFPTRSTACACPHRLLRWVPIWLMV
jgi:succinate dehydrogenase/fumarate reductase cytochrome b subunit